MTKNPATASVGWWLPELTAARGTRAIASSITGRPIANHEVATPSGQTKLSRRTARLMSEIRQDDVFSATHLGIGREHGGRKLGENAGGVSHAILRPALLDCLNRRQRDGVHDVFDQSAARAKSEGFLAEEIP